MQYHFLTGLEDRTPYPLDWSVAELYIDAEQYELACEKLNELADLAWMDRNDEWLNKSEQKIKEIKNKQ